MHSHCENCINISRCSKKVVNKDFTCPIICCALKCGLQFHQCKLEEHTHLCANEIISCINVEYGCPLKIQRYKISSHLPNCPASVVVCTLLLDHWPLYPELGEKSTRLKDTMVTANGLPSSFLGIDVPSDIATSVTMPFTRSSPEVFTINPIKPYTFSCNQSFRRGEYNWHYKNVHNEIHCSLNGPIIQWCPLAQYGCNFSRKRLYPAPQGSLISYNNIVGSFGVIPLPQMSEPNYIFPTRSQEYSDKKLPVCNGTTEVIEKNKSPEFDYFSVMPFEVLQTIACYLDSFSLANLSLTSKHIRNVCKTLLEKKGMVHIAWIKCEANDFGSSKVTWKEKNFLWRFSNGMSPITKWMYLDGMNMSNHMKTCGYFKKKAFKDEPKCKLFDPEAEY